MWPSTCAARRHSSVNGWASCCRPRTSDSSGFRQVFAHGFYVLSDTADFQYKCTDYYAPDSERSLLWNDATVGIRWPLIDGREPRLATKDAAGRPFTECET